MTTFEDQALTYDSSDRHTATVTTGAGGATVLYSRDATDRLVSMTTTIGITSTTVPVPVHGWWRLPGLDGEHDRGGAESRLRPAGWGDGVGAERGGELELVVPEHSR